MTLLAVGLAGLLAWMAWVTDSIEVIKINQVWVMDRLEKTVDLLQLYMSQHH